MIIDFNKGNGGGNMSNYWNSAVTEEHIESAASVVYDSAKTYTDEAIAGIDLSGYYTSAQTEEAITSKNYVTSGDVKTQVEDYNYVNSGDVQTQIDASVSGKADAQNVTAGNGIPFWNAQGIITGKKSDAIGNVLTINDTSVTALTRNNLPGGSFAKIYAPTTSGVTGQILMASGNTPVWIDNNFVTSADVKTQVEAYEYVNSGQVETQILAKNYLTAEDIEPDLIYSGNPGFYAINSSALTNWQIENLDLSNYNFVRFYVKASDISFNSSDNFTAPLYVDVVLDHKSLSSQYQVYLGVTSNICAGNRNRSYHVIAAVDITKTKVQLLYQTTLWDISASSAADNGRYCYKIEGYKYNVCGAAENGGGGEAYTAGANINISQANVISVSGLSTINGSAITGGGNLVIEGGSSEMDELQPVSELPPAAEPGTVLAINSPYPFEEIGLFQYDGRNDIWAGFTKSSDNSIKDIVKIEQSDYDALVALSETVPTTLYIVVPDSE